MSSFKEVDLPGIPEHIEPSWSISIKKLTSIADVEDAASCTSGKEVRITPARWASWLDSEHSPIREFKLAITCTGMSYFTSVHFVRHKIGVEHYVRSHREDRTGAPRSLDDLVTHRMSLNAASLIAIMRKRLCGKAAEDTRLWATRIKAVMSRHPDEYVRVLAEFLRPECDYRGHCPEFKSCGRYSSKEHQNGL